MWRDIEKVVSVGLGSVEYGCRQKVVEKTISRPNVLNQVLDVYVKSQGT